MIAFTVHEPPNAPADRIDRGEKLEFVRDGFAPLAAALPPLWMMLNGLWIALLVYLIGVTAIDLALGALGATPPLIALITLAMNLLVGFEADAIKRWTLRRGGWSELGTVVGRNKSECERRFFDGWLIEQPMLRPGTPHATDRLLGSAPLPLPVDSTGTAKEPAAPKLRTWRSRLWPLGRKNTDAPTAGS